MSDDLSKSERLFFERRGVESLSWDLLLQLDPGFEQNIIIEMYVI